MATQTEIGKAFEFACVKAIHMKYYKNQKIILADTIPLKSARTFYEKISEELQKKMDLAAEAGLRIIERLEPQLQISDGTPLYLAIQEDAKGIEGDVRDVICSRTPLGWNIGLSCKHNHKAVKHSRLSNKIDFGEKWFGRPCSSEYFCEIKPLFQELYKLKEANELWRNIYNKEAKFYKPLLIAFINELKRLYEKFNDEIPAKLVTYLLGNQDFYKVIANDLSHTTEVQAFNIRGTLNKNAGSVKPNSKIPLLNLPSSIHDVSFKDQSTNTIEITLNNGWAVTMRIHNASSRVEPSLKFDVNLLGMPSTLGTLVEPW